MKQNTTINEKLREKLKWERGFQKWCDGQSMDDTEFCGSGYICDYCRIGGYDKPCVCALNAYLRDTKKSIDYEKDTFKGVWDS